MGLVDNCRVGIETFATTFEYTYRNYNGKCVHMNSTAIAITSDAWKAYNNTVCELAEGCYKAAHVGESFFRCIKDAFCANATDAVKAMGQVVYQLNKESAYDSAVQALPWCGGVVVAGLAVSILVDSCAPQNKVTKAASVVSKVVAGIAALFAAHSFDIIRAGK